MKQQPFTVSETLFGSAICARLVPLDDGLHVLLAGGQRSHVGAVCLAENGQVVAIVSYPGHKEQVVAERWAVTLSARLRQPVTVACGIHYDNAVHSQIDAVLAVCDKLLEQAVRTLSETDA